MSFQINNNPASAVIRVNLSRPENVAKQGIVYNSLKGDGSYAILGSVVDSINISYKGMNVPADAIKDANVEVRIAEQNLEMFLAEAEKVNTRAVEVKLVMTAEPSFKKLTLKNGDEVNSIVFFGVIEAVREASSILEGDSFETEEDFLGFLKGAQEIARNNRSNARTQLQLARESAMTTEAKSKTKKVKLA